MLRTRLDTMIDLRHRLAVLATRLPWADIEAAWAPAFAHRDRTGRLVEGADLFGPTTHLAGSGASHAGRPRLQLRPMVSLLYLKHAFNLSDEELVERRSENVVWPFFSSMTYYEPRVPWLEGAEVIAGTDAPPSSALASGCSSGARCRPETAGRRLLTPGSRSEDGPCERSCR